MDDEFFLKLQGHIYAACFKQCGFMVLSFLKGVTFFAGKYILESLTFSVKIYSSFFFPYFLREKIYSTAPDASPITRHSVLKINRPENASHFRSAKLTCSQHQRSVPGPILTVTSVIHPFLLSPDGEGIS
ncbi:hypothetical protein [Serratia symbiotica]|uniref:Uncharacterized protein n=1 Tax=Serratia symbiotica TaxID=138074 RepID=A0A7D5NTL4_9GAMM|nr:hypothetical protein [Serratia symbiotica]QLH62424.1 hypothetical protein SYMBAF_05030 [Serratia symbiotica]